MKIYEGKGYAGMIQNTSRNADLDVCLAGKGSLDTRMIKLADRIIRDDAASHTERLAVMAEKALLVSTLHYVNSEMPEKDRNLNRAAGIVMDETHIPYEENYEKYKTDLEKKIEKIEERDPYDDAVKYYKAYMGFRQDRFITAASVAYQVMDYIARQE